MNCAKFKNEKIARIKVRKMSDVEEDELFEILKESDSESSEEEQKAIADDSDSAEEKYEVKKTPLAPEDELKEILESR